MTPEELEKQGHEDTRHSMQMLAIVMLFALAVLIPLILLFFMKGW